MLCRALRIRAAGSPRAQGGTHDSPRAANWERRAPIARRRAPRRAAGPTTTPTPRRTFPATAIALRATVTATITADDDSARQPAAQRRRPGATILAHVAGRPAAPDAGGVPAAVSRRERPRRDRGSLRPDRRPPLPDSRLPVRRRRDGGGRAAGDIPRSPGARRALRRLP